MSGVCREAAQCHDALILHCECGVIGIMHTAATFSKQVKFLHVWCSKTFDFFKLLLLSGRPAALFQ